MKKRIAGIISFIGASAWLVYLIIIIFKEPLPSEILDYLFMAGTIIIIISNLLYIVWTNFGTNKPTEIKKIEYENQILIKKIEQQELKKKLEI